MKRVKTLSVALSLSIVSAPGIGKVGYHFDRYNYADNVYLQELSRIEYYLSQWNNQLYYPQRPYDYYYQPTESTREVQYSCKKANIVAAVTFDQDGTEKTLNYPLTIDLVTNKGKHILGNYELSVLLDPAKRRGLLGTDKKGKRSKVEKKASKRAKKRWKRVEKSIKHALKAERKRIEEYLKKDEVYEGGGEADLYHVDELTLDHITDYQFVSWEDCSDEAEGEQEFIASCSEMEGVYQGKLPSQIAQIQEGKETRHSKDCNAVDRERDRVVYSNYYQNPSYYPSYDYVYYGDRYIDYAYGVDPSVTPYGWEMNVLLRSGHGQYSRDPWAYYYQDRYLNRNRRYPRRDEEYETFEL